MEQPLPVAGQAADIALQPGGHPLLTGEERSYRRGIRSQGLL